jgi:hypothetical protein
MNKKRFSSRALLLILLLYPIVHCTPGAQAASGGSPSPSESGSSAGNLPLAPIAQPLFPEGALAMELVQALKIGQAENETEAQIMLSAIGIEPKNGWIADYPITPDIMAEIEEVVVSAAEGRKISLGKEGARRAVREIWALFGLNVSWNPPSRKDPEKTSPTSTGRFPIYRYMDANGVVHFTDRYDSIPKEYRGETETILPGARPDPSPVSASKEIEPSPPPTGPTPPALPAPEVIHHYYVSCGPPVITYYPPPLPYAYLYVWVPYPFWCGRVYFSGFFILYDFRRTIFFHRRPFVVSNYFICGRTQIVYRIDPIHRHLGGSKALARPPSIKLSATPQGQAAAKEILNLHPPKGDPAAKASTPGVQNPPTPTAPAPRNFALRSSPAAISQAPQPTPLVKNESRMQSPPSLSPMNQEPIKQSGIAPEDKKVLPQRGIEQKLNPSGSSKKSPREMEVHQIFPIPPASWNRPNHSNPSFGTGPLGGPRSSPGGFGGRGSLR